MFYEGMDKDGDFSISEDEWMRFNYDVYDRGSPEMGFMLLRYYERRLELREDECAFLLLADELFDGYDHDGSGSLDPSEVIEFTNPDAEADERWQTARNFIQQMDQDRSGTLERGEWRDFMFKFWRRNKHMALRFAGTLMRDLNEKKAAREFLDEAVALFHEYDVDASGALSPMEMVSMLGVDNIPTVAEFFRLVDRDQSLSIDLGEWTGFMRRSYERKKETAQRFVKEIRWRLKRKRAEQRAAAAALEATKRYY